jgi:hypothetical protein
VQAGGFWIDIINPPWHPSLVSWWRRVEGALMLTHSSDVASRACDSAYQSLALVLRHQRETGGACLLTPEDGRGGESGETGATRMSVGRS